MRLPRHSLLAGLVIGLLAASPTLGARQDVPAGVTRYTLTARLDVVNGLILGQGRLEWRNTSAAPTSELRVLMPWNAWQHDRTSWANERRIMSPARPLVLNDSDRGSMDLAALRITPSSGTPVDALSRAVPIAPDDRNGDDRTVWSVPLDEPLQPGHSVDLEFRWTARVPAFIGGQGRSGSFYLLTQWFPRMGVLQDDGWQAHQVHVGVEAFTDFGTYDVDLQVPTGWAVAGSGKATGSRPDADGFTSHHFRAEGVSDFGWTTAPSFVERTDRIVDAGRPAVDIRLLLRPEHAAHADRQMAATRAAIAWHVGALGPFPFDSLTIVDTPAADPDGGNDMAVAPGLVPVGGRWFSPWSEAALERQTMAGVADQYFRARVAPDTVAFPWLGRGLVNYVAARGTDDAFHGRFVSVERYFRGLITWPYSDVPWTRIQDGAHVSLLRTSTGPELAATAGWRQHPTARLVDAQSRIPLALLSLEQLLGWDTTRAALAAYALRGSGRHPVPDEFASIVDSTGNRDLSWFFRTFDDGAASFDYAVTTVTSTPTGADSMDSTVVLTRLGDGTFPVEVRVSFADEASLLDRWDGRDRTRVMKYRRGAEIVRVEIDPDHVLALDINRTNNSWTRAPQARAAADRWTPRWAMWVQHLLLTYAFFV